MVLLPVWKTCLEALKLPINIMPWDVSTRWNSTYDMLSFAVQYWWAIKHITSDQRNDLWESKLLEDEWEIAEDMLKVHGSHVTCGCTEQYVSRSWRMRLSTSRVELPTCLLWSQPWITLILPSPPLHFPPAIKILRFAQPLSCKADSQQVLFTYGCLWALSNCNGHVFLMCRHSLLLLI